MKYANVEVSPVCVLPGVPRINDVTVKLVESIKVQDNSPKVVDPLAAILVKKI